MIPEYFTNNVIFLTSVDVLGRTIIHNTLDVYNTLMIGESSADAPTLYVNQNVGILTETPNVELTVNGKISSNSVIYDELGNSSQWNSVYSTVCAKSGIEWDNSIVQNYVTNSFLPLSGGTLTGKLTILTDPLSAGLNIGNPKTPTNPSIGDIWLGSGGIRYEDPLGVERIVADSNRTNIFSFPQVIDTDNPNSALRITTRGIGNAILIEDKTNPDNSPFLVDANGTVGLGLSSLSGVDAKLTVVGNVSSTAIIYASGGNSELWNSVYGLVNTISSNWDSTYNTLYNLSASLEESNEILSTVKNYLSTNNVLICSLDVFSNASIESNLSVGQTLYVGDQSLLIPTLYVDDNDKVGILTETPNVELTVNGKISSNSIIYDEIGNSTLWNSVYTNINQNSATYTKTNFVYNNFLPLSGGTMTGKLNLFPSTISTVPINLGSGEIPTNTVAGDLFSSGNNIWFKGTTGGPYIFAYKNDTNTFYLPQIISTVSPTGDTLPALRITQTGGGECLRIEDETNPDLNAFIVNSSGSVGIGLSSMNNISSKLTVVGSISATQEIYVNEQKTVKTITTETNSLSSVNSIVVVSELPAIQTYGTLYILV